MDELKREELYKGLIEVFGAGHQMDVAVEEMAELTNALMKYKQLRATKEEVVTEIADVIVCMEQMSRYFGIEAVVAEKERKLKRQTEGVKRLCAKIEAKEDTLQPRMAATPTEGNEGAAKDGCDTDTRGGVETTACGEGVDTEGGGEITACGESGDSDEKKE